MGDAEYDKKIEFKKEVDFNSNSKSKKDRSPSTNHQQEQQFSGNDESVKREQFERNFLQLKTTCSTLFEKFTARISNYYVVTKTGMSNSSNLINSQRSNAKNQSFKDEQQNLPKITTTNASSTNPFVVTPTNQNNNDDFRSDNSNLNVNSNLINSIITSPNSISSSLNLVNSKSVDSNITSKIVSPNKTIINFNTSSKNNNNFSSPFSNSDCTAAATNSVNNSSSSSTQTNSSAAANSILNRSFAGRRNSRSNLGSTNESPLNQQFKMTREQLSPAVNAQCLSPRPRPKELNMGSPSLKKPQQNPIGTLNTSLVSRNNSVHINGKDYEIDEADFKYIEQLGAGTCGTVNKMEHIRSKAIVAVKEMTRSSHPEDNKRINMDLEVLLKCNNVEHIVQCYGYLIKGTRVWIVMELMTTCLDKLLKKTNSPFPEPICGKIAVASIKSLDYLKTEFSVIHRDVKPSNILINSIGEIKLCDFGVSGRLVDSYAKTKQGCEAYMAPERILPPDPSKPSYDIRADVWSLGITLVQLALGRYPYQNCRGDFELLTKIIESDPPILPENSTFSNYFKEFIKLCLEKDVEKRPKYKYLKWDPFYLKYDRENVDIRGWFNRAWTS